MEAGRAASDGTTHNNGYGICFIPQTWLTEATWNASNTIKGAYKSSTMHTSHLPNIVTKLQRVLGSHIVQRNVLLSSGSDGNNRSNAYTWTTAYATLMSVGQMNGNFAAYSNKYDDGEANYMLPIFNYKDFKTGYEFWSRGIWGYNSGGFYGAWCVGNAGGLGCGNIHATAAVRPLIYLR